MSENPIGAPPTFVSAVQSQHDASLRFDIIKLLIGSKPNCGLSDLLMAADRIIHYIKTGEDPSPRPSRADA